MLLNFLAERPQSSQRPRPRTQKSCSQRASPQGRSSGRLRCRLSQGRSWAGFLQLPTRVQEDLGRDLPRTPPPPRRTLMPAPWSTCQPSLPTPRLLQPTMKQGRVYTVLEVPRIRASCLGARSGGAAPGPAGDNQAMLPPPSAGPRGAPGGGPQTASSSPLRAKCFPDRHCR